jgi:hypothetical protein
VVAPVMGVGVRISSAAQRILSLRFEKGCSAKNNPFCLIFRRSTKPIRLAQSYNFMSRNFRRESSGRENHELDIIGIRLFVAFFPLSAQIPAHFFPHLIKIWCNLLTKTRMNNK